MSNPTAPMHSPCVELLELCCGLFAEGIEWLIAEGIEVPARSTADLAAQKHIILGKQISRKMNAKNQVLSTVDREGFLGNQPKSVVSGYRMAPSVRDCETQRRKARPPADGLTIFSLTIL